MTPNSKKIATLMSLFLTVLLASTFAISRRQRGDAGEDLGVFSDINGRVELRGSTSRTWIDPAISNPAPSGVSIRVGSGSAIISSIHHKIHLGPDTDISSRWKNKKLEITLHAGEMEFIKDDGLLQASISTDFGDVLMSEPASFIVSRPAGAKFAVVIPRSGLISVAQHGEGRPIVAGSSPVVLSAKNVNAIWALDPAPGINLDSVEGHQAVTFSWAEARYLVDSKSTTPLPSILIRNLATGEMVVQENAQSPAEYTLPAGPYSWVVRSGEMVTCPRLFQIRGASIQSASAEEPQPEGTWTGAVEPPPEKTLPVAVEPQPEKTLPVAVEPQPEKALPVAVEPQPEKALPVAVEPQPEKALPLAAEATPPDASTSTVNPEPKESSSTTTKNSVPATVALLLPHKGIEIPFSLISEQRVQWKASGNPESFELDVVGSAGNPSLHFTLLGHRTRQKLMLLPPGRYTVRLRTATGVAPAQVTSEWVESFFDVVQTEAGQLSPQNIEYKVTTVHKRSVITVMWDKGPAPQYQIKMTATSLPTTLLLTKRHKAILKRPESGNVLISVCALDANKRVRGCAPDIRIP